MFIVKPTPFRNPALEGRREAQDPGLKAMPFILVPVKPESLDNAGRKYPVFNLPRFPA
jgi:hypothetical protein